MNRQGAPADPHAAPCRPPLASTALRFLRSLHPIRRLAAQWRKRTQRLTAGGPIFLTGRLYVVDTARRFGLIDSDDGRIVFFHLEATAGADLEDFVEGASVAFDERVDRLGCQARTVLLICAGDTMEAPCLDEGASYPRLQRRRAAVQLDAAGMR